MKLDKKIKWTKTIEKWKIIHPPPNQHIIIITIIIIIFIIIIIKKGQQCKAEREWCTPYQSEDPSPTIPTYRQKEDKGKKSRRL